MSLVPIGQVNVPGAQQMVTYAKKLPGMLGSKATPQQQVARQSAAAGITAVGGAVLGTALAPVLGIGIEMGMLGREMYQTLQDTRTAKYTGGKQGEFVLCNIGGHPDRQSLTNISPTGMVDQTPRKEIWLPAALWLKKENHWTCIFPTLAPNQQIREINEYDIRVLPGWAKAKMETSYRARIDEYISKMNKVPPRHLPIDMVSLGDTVEEGGRRARVIQFNPNGKILIEFENGQRNLVDEHRVKPVKMLTVRKKPNDFDSMDTGIHANQLIWVPTRNKKSGSPRELALVDNISGSAIEVIYLFDGVKKYVDEQLTAELTPDEKEVFRGIKAISTFKQNYSAGMDMAPLIFKNNSKYVNYILGHMNTFRNPRRFEGAMKPTRGEGGRTTGFPDEDNSAEVHDNMEGVPLNQRTLAYSASRNQPTKRDDTKISTQNLIPVAVGAVCLIGLLISAS